jgi:hypothetical protein
MAGGGVGRGVVVLVTAVALVALAGGIALASGAWSPAASTAPQAAPESQASTTDPTATPTTRTSSAPRSTPAATRARADSGGNRTGTPVTISAIQGKGLNEGDIRKSLTSACLDADLPAGCARPTFREKKVDTTQSGYCEAESATPDIFRENDVEDVTIGAAGVVVTMRCPTTPPTDDPVPEESGGG